MSHLRLSVLSALGLPTAIFVLAWSAPAQEPGTSYRFEVIGPTAPQRAVLSASFDVVAESQTALQVVVLPEELASFQGVAPQATLLDRGRPFHDIALERAAANQQRTGTSYLTVAQCEAEMDLAVAAYPGIAQKVDISALPGGMRTIENRAMFALKVSDNVATDEDEPAIVIAAQHHARELNSPIMVTCAWDRILTAYATDPQLQAVVDGYELWFVPIVNPDGVEHVWNVDSNWRKNRRNNGGSFGVDLNRNYPFLWGVCGASTLGGSQTYRGAAPASEPETQTMINLTRLLRPEIYLDFHSSGQEVLALYPPCASVTSAITAMSNSYITDLRSPMAYATRVPSASGEAPHDHWAAGGALSYLVEIGTSFQPPFATTLAEESRVWPGTRRLLTAWRPAVRGHVRSALGNAPVEATITFRQSPTNAATFNHGEVTMSRARDGRYGLWLPLGTWNVTYTAPGHQPHSVVVTNSSYNQPQSIEVVLDPVQQSATLTAQGSPRIGTTMTFDYTSPGDAGDVCLFGWSLGTAPGIPLGGGRAIPLNGDFLFEAMLRGNSALSPSWQLLDAVGHASAQLVIPNIPGLVGFTSHIAGITFDAGYAAGVEQWSAPLSITVLP